MNSIGSKVPVTDKAMGWYRTRRVAPIVMFLAFLLGAVYTYSVLDSGWLPEDDGTLAQGALRVLNGGLPHRDFVENYTGGLSCLHALVFKLGGINLVSLRICVFLFFLLWLAAVLYIASRFVSAIPGRWRRTAGSSVEPASVSCRDAVLVQPVLCHLRGGCAYALHRHPRKAMVVSGRVMRRYFLSNQNYWPVLRCGSTSFSTVPRTTAKLHRRG